MSDRFRAGGQPWGRVGTAPGGSEGRAVRGVGTAGVDGLEVRAAGAVGAVKSWKERVKLMCRFQDNQRFPVISLSCGFSSFPFRYSCSAPVQNIKWKIPERNCFYIVFPIMILLLLVV